MLNQCGFRPGDSCINRLLSRTHKIYNAFDEELEAKSAFLYISKPVDQKWHKGFLFKLLQVLIFVNFLDLLSSFFERYKTKKCHRRRSSRFHFETILLFDIYKIYLVTYPLKQNCFPMIHLYFP